MRLSTQLALVATAVAGAFFTTAQASAASPCWKQVIADWSADKAIGRGYPQTCYDQALAHLPVDVQWYSTAGSDIRAAMVAAARTRAAAHLPEAGARRTLASRTDASATELARTTRAPDPAALPTPLLLASAACACLLALGAVSRIRRRRDLRQLLKRSRRSR